MTTTTLVPPSTAPGPAVRPGAPIRIVSVDFAPRPLVGPAGPTDIPTTLRRSLRLRPV